MASVVLDHILTGVSNYTLLPARDPRVRSGLAAERDSR